MAGRGGRRAARDPGAPSRFRLPPSRLRWRCPLKAIPADPPSGPENTVGQDRALEALRLGLDVRAPGYNIFVSGISGTGRTTTVLHMVKELAPSCPVPRDRAYVHNFAAPERPRLLTLHAGRASELRRDLEELGALLRRILPASLEDREFHRRRDEILRRAAAEEKRLLEEFRAPLAAAGFALLEISGEGVKRLEIHPLVDGEPVPPDRWRDLAAEGRIPREAFEAGEAKLLELRRELAQVLRRDREIARDMNREVGAVLQEAVRGALAGAFEDLRARWTEASVRSHLAAVEADVLEHIVPLAREAAGGEDEGEGRLRLYGVHVLVDRRGLRGCPVVHETAPTVAGLFGNVERRPVGPGVFVADHTTIRAGSLLEADGGFIVLSAEDVFADPEVARHFRRVLKHRRLEIRSVDGSQGAPGPGLAPEAIDLDVKVILVGDWRAYELLYRASHEFAETFRVKADFEPDMDVSLRNLRHFLRVAGRIARKAGALPVSREGYAAIAEEGVRSSGRQGKITARFSDVGEVLREADYWARREGAKEIGGPHVLRAVDRMAERSRLTERRIQDLIDREILLIETSGSRVGRVNGLSVYDLGYYAFGKPTVITASTGVGLAGIINVEREARLSGGIYDKGVLIIAGWLRRTFAQNRPLSLTASVCFEQSYAGVDGDSASVAEVAALVSELSGVPVDQGVAVTGSLNQHGYVQPIGGVNEKIEGFFEVCGRRGLTGTQGVVIPRANAGDLMLSPAVVEACAAGRFSVWAVARVEEALTLLLGSDPGRQRADGTWPAESLFGRVDARLRDYAARLGGSEDWRPVDGTRSAGGRAPGEPPAGPFEEAPG
ncbi:MAG: AAA family ATPase [Planctomycetes bacterium]|nr:AAA family ATPase [Planctomycetota bacterium]